MHKGVLRFFLCFLLWLVSSCMQPKMAKMETIHAGNPDYHLGRITLQSDHPRYPIELEILQYQEQIYIYFNSLSSWQFPPVQENLKQTNLIMHTENQTFSFFLDLLSGGQRIRLSPKQSLEFLQKLQEMGQIRLEIGPYAHTFFGNIEPILCKLKQRAKKPHLNTPLMLSL